MEALQLQHYTIEDIYALPEGKRAELIDGQIYYMASPSTRHQRILGRLYKTISNYIDSKDDLCEVFPAPFAVFLNNDDVNYVEPDISVICDPDKIDERGCNGAPDWIIEITSPNNSSHDYITKLYKYKTAGVREYWIVDPMEETILVYHFEAETLRVKPYSFRDNIKVNIYDDLQIDFHGLGL